MANIRENILILLDTNIRQGEDARAGIRGLERYMQDNPAMRESTQPFLDYALEVKGDLDARRGKYWRGLIRHTDYSSYSKKLNHS